MADATMPSGWKLVRFESLVEDAQLGTTERGADENGPNVNLIKMGNLTWGGFALANIEQVAAHKLNGNDCTLRAGDLLFNTRNSADLVGKSAIWRESFGTAAYDNNINRLRLIPEAHPEFFGVYLNTGEGKKSVQALAVGSTSVAAIYWKDLSKLKLPLPPLSEQRKIAEFLRTWDEAIEQASRVIELLQSQYLGARDQLIDWNSGPRKSLQCLLEPVSRPTPRPTVAYRALSIRSHGKGTFVRTVADPNSVDMDTLYIAREGDLVVNITFAWEGAVALIPKEHDGCLVSHRFPTFIPIPECVSARYLRHALRMPRFTYFLGLVSPGGAGRNRVLNKGNFLELEVPAPELSKQDLIASALDTAETAIAKALKYRECLTRQKRGLMQKLLTGEWRVQVEVD